MTREEIEELIDSLSVEEFTYALSNSLGFGGHNASIIIKKYTER